MTSEFLDLKSFSGENFSQIEEKNFRTQKIDLDPQMGTVVVKGLN